MKNRLIDKSENKSVIDYAPYQVGETVYIKEAWCESYYGEPICYKLDGKESPGPKDFWRSPLFMPAWAARYFIQITDVRAQRVQEISYEDIIAEGVDTGQDVHYQELWDSINPKYPFASNCWVWAYTFKLVNKEGE